jgi:hypothetical protein
LSNFQEFLSINKEESSSLPPFNRTSADDDPRIRNEMAFAKGNFVAHHGRAMKCPEDARLRQSYESVLQLCHANREVLDRVYLRGVSYRHRMDLLKARSKAANELYHHSVTCQECKASRQALKC